MNRLIITLLAAFYLSLSSLTAEVSAPPLYQRFRPVTSLPWREPGATLESVLKRIYRDPDYDVRDILLKEYLCSISADQFPQAFDLCIALEEDDTPDHAIALLMRAWAEVDPEAAWVKCDALLETIMSMEALDVDSWGTEIRVLNLEAVRKANFWPMSSMVSDFLEGLARSHVDPGRKARLQAIAEARDNANQAARDELYSISLRRGKVNGPPVYPKLIPPAAYRSEVPADLDGDTEDQRLLRLLTCPLAGLPAVFENFPADSRQHFALHALVRWMDGDGKKAPDIAREYLRLQKWTLKDTASAGESPVVLADEPLPIGFLMEWALLDPAGYLAWVDGEPSPEGGFFATARPADPETVIPHDTPHAKAVATVLEGDATYRKYVREIADGMEAGEADNPDTWAWAGLDPATALPWIWNHDGPRMYGTVVGDQAYAVAGTLPNMFRTFMKALDDFEVPVPDTPLYELMEEWTSIDEAGSARHGVRWHLKTRYFTRERMIRLWTAREEPEDMSMDDRCFGALRIWAVRKPDEVRAWIAGEPFDNEVKAALNWLVDHAANGYPLREVVEGNNTTYLPILPP